MCTTKIILVLSFTEDDEPGDNSIGAIIGAVVAAVGGGTISVVVILVVLYVFCVRPKKTAIHDGNSYVYITCIAISNK